MKLLSTAQSTDEPPAASSSQHHKPLWHPSFETIFSGLAKPLLGGIALTLSLATVSFAQVGEVTTEQTAVEATAVEAAAVENSEESVLSESAQVVQPQSVTQASPGSTATAAVAPPAPPTPEPTPFSPAISGITDISAGTDAISGVGHLRPADLESLGDDDVDWLSSAIVPLYVAPGGDHWGWIYQGWLIPQGSTYLAIGRDAGFTMVRPYENLHTFPVLETRADGWFRVQYTEGGSAWAHTSQLNLGETELTVETWEERLATEDSVYFLDSSKAQPLRSQPQSANNMLSLIPADSLIEPSVFQGDWMLVRVTRPTANCQPLTGATVTEGWMRWRTEDGKALAWSEPEGRCSE